MRNLYIDVRIGNVIAILKPLFWLLLIEILVFAIFTLIPQGHDVYVYLLEEGFWTNAFPIFLLFISLIFLSCSSGLGGEMILSLSTLKVQSKPSDAPSTDDAYPTEESYLTFRNWLVTFLWYFPTLSFLLGFYKVIIFQKQNGAEGFGNNAVFLTLLFSLLGLSLIYRVRKGIWAYIGNEMRKLQNDAIRTEKLLNNFKGFGKITSVNVSKDGTPIRKVTLKDDYRPLVNVLAMLFTTSALLFIIFAALPTNFYYVIGAAPLLVFGLGAWTNVYVGVELIDKLYNEKRINPFTFNYNGNAYSLSLKMLILIWVLFCSYTNNDHPINTTKGDPLRPKITLPQNFQTYSRITKQDSTSKIPIIFVSVDGGASRTGLFGAMMLSVMQDSLSNIKDHIFAYSDISGGTLGANIFYALSRDGFESKRDTDTCYSEQVRRFFKRDFLAPIIGTFLFGDVVGYFWPGYIKKFDRGIALEKEWQSAWKDMMPFLANKEENAMELGAKRMLEIPDTTKFKPVMFINSHEVETGRRAIYSNVKLDSTVFSGISDLNQKVKTDLPFSSAILLSARFPLISPSGMIQVNDYIKRHYVDGGYFESSGTLTLYEALRNLETALDTSKYNVFVIHLDGGEDVIESEYKGVNFLNEPVDIVNGAIADRSGHTEFAVENLKNYVTKQYTASHFITLKVGGSLKAVPVNWVLSSSAIDQVLKRCKSFWNQPELNVLQKIVASAKNEGSKSPLLIPSK